ncbi:MAG: efflux RND transporter periplasmic adaptor subunit [Candidatus Sumerlaeia bacterium]
MNRVSFIGAWVGAAVAVSVAAGCGNGGKQSLGFTDSAHATQAPAPAAGGNVASSRSDLLTTAVTVVNRGQTVGLTGTLAPDEETRVAARVSGIVQTFYVDRGSMVRKGDPLVQLDPTNARNSLAEGEASAEELRVKLGMKNENEPFDPKNMPDVKVVKAKLDLAERNYRRYKALDAGNAIAKSEFDRVSSELEAARSTYDQTVRQALETYQGYKTAMAKVVTLRQTLADTLIVAPFDGMVVEKLTSVGEWLEVMMGTGNVVRLVKVSPLRLKVTVPQQYVGQIRPGQVISFTVEGFPGETFHGRVNLISPALDTATRSLTVEALVDNADFKLRPGLFATARLDTGASSVAMFVPASALTHGGDVTRLFVVSGGVARQKIVTVGETTPQGTQIIAGLDKAERVILNPAGVSDGSAVN